MDENTANKNTDVIVVGAGPSGIAAATIIARGGKRVVVIERSKNYGTKNMFGGAVYLKSIKELFPNSYEKAPYERITKTHQWSFLTLASSVNVSYNFYKMKSSASVFRPKFDSWMVEEAKKEGVYFAPSTTVRELIVKDEKVIGVKTDLEEFFAPLVIIADGACSLLAEQIGLSQKIEPKDVILGVKEIIKLPPNVIENRFNLEQNSKQGAILEFFGGFGEDILALTYLYTFKNYVGIGLGVLVEDLACKHLKPYNLLDKIKEHPSIKNYIQDGEVVEYSAHLLPEWGYNKLPKMYTNGAMLVGDALGVVNPVHFEGTNLAIYSGIYAGETALYAINKNDFSKEVLSIYEKKLLNSFVGQDLKSYRNVIKTAIKRKKTIFGFYPKIASDFFEMFTGADPIPKKKGYRAFLKEFFFSRNITELFKDCYEFAKTFIEVLK